MQKRISVESVMPDLHLVLEPVQRCGRSVIRWWDRD